MEKKAEQILERLAELYPDAQCELNFEDPFQLLIATILSAQCTDKKVNKVTSSLFKKYPRPEDFIGLGQEGLEQEIRELGLFRNKAKNIVSTCRELIEQYGGQVPSDLEKLRQLPGVGRKTANVVASNAFGIPAIAVDTHVFRVSNRLGLASSNSVDQVEKQLMELIPPSRWSETHHQLIWHGRRVCDARKPRCGECTLSELCLYFNSNK